MRSLSTVLIHFGLLQLVYRKSHYVAADYFDDTEAEYENTDVGTVSLSAVDTTGKTPNQTDEPYHKLPEFKTRREELLYWANYNKDAHVPQTHLAEVAACLLMKDEQTDILEWLAYHRYIGISKYYVYDNNSKPPMLDILLPYVSEGVVDYLYLNDTWKADDFLFTRRRVGWMKQTGYASQKLINSVQIWSMTHCVKNYAQRHKWVVMMDVDEFFMFTDNDPSQGPPHLPTFLKDYEDAGGLAVYRRNLGSSGVTRKPEAGVMASYTKCMKSIDDDKRQFYPKVILQSQYLRMYGACFVHECQVKRKMVNTLKKEPPNQKVSRREMATWDKLVIYHYAVKSTEDFYLKQARGMPHIFQAGLLRRDEEFLNMVNNHSTVNCTMAVQYPKYCCEDAIKESVSIYQNLKNDKSTIYHQAQESIEALLTQ
eukprot:TRINITY_DN25805_c0_g1_i1.p2 TRINITY_DN25805_c0_g1~~TRINITY_DN25805_c0_g1_i1.p2  ORF type:complete len:426 (-),score=44.08 TRINITY_DN25805_c0_g1_i1:1447-2724(-)